MTRHHTVPGAVGSAAQALIRQTMALPKAGRQGVHSGEARPCCVISGLARSDLRPALIAAVQWQM